MSFQFQMFLFLLLQFENQLDGHALNGWALPLPPPSLHAVVLHGNLIEPNHFIPECAETLTHLSVLEAKLPKQIL